MTRPEKDLRLREAMIEIEAVIKRKNLGAIVSLHSSTHHEYKFFLEPSWSAIKLLRRDHADLKPNSSHAPWRVESTLAMLSGMKRLCALFSGLVDRTIRQVEQSVEPRPAPEWKELGP